MQGEFPLDAYGTVTLDSNGQGTVTLGPAKFNESWEVEGASVNVTSNTNEPQVRFYRDQVSTTTLINGSYSGSFDADPAFNHTVYPQRKLAVQWTGGDAGAIATVRLFGKDRFK